MLGHAADLLQGHQLSDLEILEHPAQFIANGRRRTGNHIGPIDEILPFETLAEHRRRVAALPSQAGPNRCLSPIARSVGKFFGNVNAFVVEVLQMFGIILFGLSISLRHTDQLQITEPIRVQLHSLRRATAPISRADSFAILVTEIRQCAIYIVMIERPVPGLD